MRVAGLRPDLKSSSFFASSFLFCRRAIPCLSRLHHTYRGSWRRPQPSCAVAPHRQATQLPPPTFPSPSGHRWPSDYSASSHLLCVNPNDAGYRLGKLRSSRVNPPSDGRRGVATRLNRSLCVRLAWALPDPCVRKDGPIHASHLRCPDAVGGCGKTAGRTYAELVGKGKSVSMAIWVHTAPHRVATRSSMMR